MLLFLCNVAKDSHFIRGKRSENILLPLDVIHVIRTSTFATFSIDLLLDIQIVDNGGHVIDSQTGVSAFTIQLDGEKKNSGFDELNEFTWLLSIYRYADEQLK